MENQQKIKNLTLTDKEISVLIEGIYDSLFAEEEWQNSILEDMQELISAKSREEDKKMLNASKEKVKILQGLREKLNSLTWEK